MDLNRDIYETFVRASKSLLLVDFWGPQCGPCLALMPFVDQLEASYKERISVAKVNAAENRMLCAKMRVMGLPTFILYNDGAEVKRLTGQQLSEQDLVNVIDEALAAQTKEVP